jgi:hypothetical protein
MEELEQLHKMQQARKFYKEINKERKEYNPRLTVCKNKQGEILCYKASILVDRWQRHFGELLFGHVRKQPGGRTRESSPRYSDGAEWPPSSEEVKRAIQKLKNCKATGSDTLQAELYKFGDKECEKNSKVYFASIDTSKPSCLLIMLFYTNTVSLRVTLVHFLYKLSM